MSNAHTFTRVSFQLDVRTDIAALYAGGLSVPSPALLEATPSKLNEGAATWRDLFHPDAASIQRLNRQIEPTSATAEGASSTSASFPRVEVSEEQLGSYRFVEDLFAELKSHFPKPLLRRCMHDGPVLLQLPFFRCGENGGVGEIVNGEGASTGLRVSTVKSSADATGSPTFPIPIEITPIPSVLLQQQGPDTTAQTTKVVSLRVTVLDTRLASVLAASLNSFHFVALEVGRLVKLPNSVGVALRRLEVSKKAAYLMKSGGGVAEMEDGASGDDEEGGFLAASRKEGDAAPNVSHFNIDDDLWGMLREDPREAGAESQDRVFTPSSDGAPGGGRATTLPISQVGQKRATRPSDEHSSLTEAVLYRQMDDDAGRRDIDEDVIANKAAALADSAATQEYPPPGKSFGLSRVQSLFQLATWIDTHVEFVGVLSACGEHASAFAFAIKRLIQLKVTVPQLVSPLESEPPSGGGSESKRELFSFVTHPNHYVRAVALFYGRYVLSIEDLLLLVLPQTKDVNAGYQDTLLNCSPDGSIVKTIRELCESLLLKDEVCEAFPPLYEYEILRSVKGRVLRLSADVQQRERDLEELARRRKEQQEASLRARVHRGGIVGGGGSRAGIAESDGGTSGGRGGTSGSLSAAGFTSVKDLSDFLRREARLANAREAHVVGFEDGELDIDSDGEENNTKPTDTLAGGIFNLTATPNQLNNNAAKGGPNQELNGPRDLETLAKMKKQQEQARQKARNAALRSTISFTSSFTAQAQSVLLPLLGLTEHQRADDPLFLQLGSYYSKSSTSY